MNIFYQPKYHINILPQRFSHKLLSRFEILHAINRNKKLIEVDVNTARIVATLNLTDDEFKQYEEQFKKINPPDSIIFASAKRGYPLDDYRVL